MSPDVRAAPPGRSAAAKSAAAKPLNVAIVRPGPRAAEEHAGAQSRAEFPHVSLRRRRDAALRLPALDDGARDPLDWIALRHNTIRPLHAYITPGARYALLRGPARPLLEELNIVGTWSNVERGRHVRAEHLGDVLALAESRPGEWAVRLHRIEVAS